VGKISLAGTRAAVRTVIRYRNGVLNGKGASLLDGYMEDLATDRIYRLMIAQRLRHGVKVADGDGNITTHTPQLVSQLFEEELARILRELPADAAPEAAGLYREARRLSEEMITRGEFDPV
jgi:malate synthase